jgi:hypothetical protein
MEYDPVGQRLVLFGGKDDSDKRSNTVWTLDATRYTWQRFETTGDVPSPLEDHVLVYDPVGRRMILHGGQGVIVAGTTWSLDLEARRWRQLPDSKGPQREDHTAVYDSRGKRMIVFGGQHANAVYDDVWALDLDPQSKKFEAWHNGIHPSEKGPEARYDHVSVFDAKKNRMLIYGGWDGDDCVDDTWAIDLEDWDWEEVRTKKSFPVCRRRAASTYDPDRNWWIVFGGFGERGYLNDVWAFDLDADVWINVTPGPQPRIDHHLAYNPVSHRIMLYGGDARLGAKFRDVWELGIDPNIQREALFRAAYH